MWINTGRHMKLTVLFTGLTLIIVSCKMGPAYKAPEVETPQLYEHAVNKTDSIGEIKWWELFNDPLLDTLIITALENNRDARIALNNVLQAEQLYNIQKAELLPDFNVQANLSYGNSQGFVLPGAEADGNYSAGAAVSWEIDLWGKIRRMNEAQLAEYMATKYGLANVRLALVSQVATLYFQLREYETSIDISRRSVALRDSSVNLIRARYEQGLVAEIDLNQAQIQQAIAASAVPFYERAAAQTSHALSVLVGINPTKIELDMKLDDMAVSPEIPPGLPSELLLRRPDLLQASELIKAQNARIGVAQAARFPALSITGLAGVSNELGTFNSTAFAWNASAGLFGPLFHWGKNKRRVEVEKIRTESAYMTYENAVLNAFREVEDALVSIETYDREVQARTNHVSAATKAQYLSGERYDKGVTSYLEYLESQRQAFEAELNLTSVQAGLLTSYVQLYKALGGGWLTQSEMDSAKETNP
ncbi:MAG: TolC family protein [Reichenbachiella sp.]